MNCFACFIIGEMILVFALVVGVTGVASSAPYYEGKTIALVAATRPGGGTDLTARLCASIMPKYIPGRPRIVIRNKPGGAGAVALNSFYQKAKPDGQAILICPSASIGLQMQKAKIAKFDLLKMRAIGNVSSGGAVIVVRKDAFGRLTDPKAKPVVVGCQQGMEMWNALPIWGREFLGWNVRWILGFTGTSHFALAFRRGEIDMFGDSRTIPALVEEGLGIALAQVGIYRNDKFVRRGDFPDVPTMVELFEEKGKKPAGTAWEAYVAFLGTALLWKLCMAPAGTPDHIVNILSDAFAKMTKDPKFLNIWKKAISPICDGKSGKETEELLRKVLAVSPSALEYTNELRRKFGIM